SEPVVLTKIADVRGLSPAEASRRYPVHVRGVVTARNRASAFIQDETAGIFVTDGRGLSPGQLVEVTGETGAGDFAPIIDKVQTKIVGTAAMPRPRVVSAVELATGKYDS